MSALKIFEKEEFGSVRVIMKDGEPWFVAKDIAQALGYASTNMTTVFQAVPEEWKGMTSVVTPGGAQALGYERPNDAVNTHCKKVNDFRDSKMLPSATPMKIIPENGRVAIRLLPPAGCWCGGGGG